MFRALCCLLLIISQPALAQSGLHYVFDASESMCGFFPKGTSTNPLLEQIKLAIETHNAQEGDRIFLLKQYEKTSDNAKHSIIDAQANLLDQSLHISKISNCKPFDGAFTNIELIFASNSPTREADAVLLITDAQLFEADRRKFVERFSSWMHESIKNNPYSSAGVALVQAQFFGKYFPISSFKKRNSYELDLHNRPLLMFWMAKSDKNLVRVQNAVSKFAPAALQKNNKAFSQHLLPAVALGLDAFQRKPNFKPNLSELLDEPKFVFQTYGNGKKRIDNILIGCLHSSIIRERLILTSDAKCQDGKPLFEGVSAINITFPIKANPYFTTASLTPNSVKPENMKLSFELTSQLFGKSQSFEFQHFPNGAKIGSHIYSIDTDTCPELAKKKCTARLDGKTYQLDSLFAQLFDSQAQTTAQLLAPLNSVKYTFEFIQRKSR